MTAEANRTPVVEFVRPAIDPRKVVIYLHLGDGKGVTANLAENDGTIGYGDFVSLSFCEAGRATVAGHYRASL